MKKIIIGILTLASCISFASDKKENARKPSSENIAKLYLELADALSQARMRGEVCENNAYQSEILRLIGVASSVQGFSKNDISGPTATQMGTMLSYKEYTGEFDGSGDEAEYRRGLVNTEFNSQSAGVMGSKSTLRLKSGGVLEVFMKTYNDETGIGKTETRAGTWNFKKSSSGKHGAESFLSVTYPLASGKMHTYTYRLMPRWDSGRKVYILHTKPKGNEGIGYDQIKYWNEIVDECGD